MLFRSSFYAASSELSSLFSLPLSRQAFAELGELQLILHDNPLNADNDVWSFCWGGKYTAKRFYDHIHAHIVVPNAFSWIWQSRCTMNLRVFAWLLLRDRLNTKDLLKRRHWNVTEDYCCVLCPLRVYEDRQHLFFTCNFSQRVWNYLQIEWPAADDIQTTIARAKRSFGHVFFMEVLIVACRHIWLQRNGAVFRNERPTFGKWKGGFVHDMTLLRYRIRPKHVDSLMAWLEALP